MPDDGAMTDDQAAGDSCQRLGVQVLIPHIYLHLDRFFIET